MEINSIKIENITSLKGTHKVSFDDKIFLNNVYAITGPTGSGKSTLLSCISLALYGKHYKDQLEPSDFVTIGEKYGKIEVEFTYKANRYLATWECKTQKKDGTVYKDIKADRNLFRFENKKLIDLGKTKIDSIMPLTFDQFCKTIVLNQGEFSKFITSDFEARKNILEKLANNQQLSLINEKVKERIKNLQKEIDDRNNQIIGLNFFSDIEINEINQNITTLTAEIKSKNDIDTKANIIFEKFTNFKKEVCIYKENNDRKIILLDLATDKNGKLNTQKIEVERAQTNLNIVQKDYETIIPKINEAEIMENNLKNINDKKLMLLEQKEFATNLQNKIITTNNNLKNEIDVNSHLFDKNCLNVKLLKLDYNQMSKLDETINQLIKNQQSKELSKQKLNHLKEIELINHTELNQIQNKITEFENKITTFTQNSFKIEEKYKTKNLDELIQNKNKHKFEIKHIKDTIKKNIPEMEGLDQKNEALQKNLHDILIQIQKKEQQILTEKNNLSQFKLNWAIDICIDHSIKNRKCVICESKDVNFLQNLHPAKEKNIEINQNEIENLQRELNQLKVTQSEIEVTLKFNTERKQGIILQELLLLKTINTDKHNIETLEKNNETEGIALINSYNEYKELVYKTSEMTEQLVNNKNKYRENTHKLRLLSDDIEKETSNHQTICNLVTENFSNLKTFTNRNIDENDIEILVREFKLLKENYSLSEHITANKKLVEKNEQEKHSISINLKNLENNFDQLTTDALEIIPKIKEIIGERTASEIKQGFSQKISFFEQELKQAQDKLRLNDKEVTEIQTKIKMVNDVLDEVIKRFKNDQLNLKIALDDFSFDIHDLHFSSLNQLSSKIGPNIPIEHFDTNVINLLHQNFDTELQVLKSSIKSLELSLQSFLTKQEQINLNIKKIGSIKNEIDVYKDQFDRLNNLQTAIGKEEFKNYVLSIIERQLILLTNHELKELCQDRYELVQFSRKKEKTDFYIIDKFNGGMQRNLFTLSGGETFLISLAMALALAEMTRGQAEVNCFFIDEGFGTLDDESILDVTQVLLQLKGRGRQIGIISHIKTLTEGLPVNIELKKDQSGYSTIMIKEN